MAGLLGALSHLTEGLFLCLLGMRHKVKHHTLSATAEPHSLCSETVHAWDLLGTLVSIQPFSVQTPNISINLLLLHFHIHGLIHRERTGTSDSILQVRKLRLGKVM